MVKIGKKAPHLGEGCQVAAPVKFCGGRLLRQSQLHRSWYRQMYIQFGPLSQLPDVLRLGRPGRSSQLVRQYAAHPAFAAPWWIYMGSVDPARDGVAQLWGRWCPVLG